MSRSVPFSKCEPVAPLLRPEQSTHTSWRSVAVTDRAPLVPAVTSARQMGGRRELHGHAVVGSGGDRAGDRWSTERAWKRCYGGAVQWALTVGEDD